MNYEKKYKELLSFLKDLKPHMSDYCIEKLEGFSLELKESEDERIRKSLIRILHVGGYMSPEDKEKAFAWLEKQDEQKPVEWSEEDEKMLKSCITILEQTSDVRNEWPLNKPVVDWLKSIKDRIKGE